MPDKVTVNDHPIPDAEKPELQEDPYRYDFDFTIAPNSKKEDEQNKDTKDQQESKDKQEKGKETSTDDKKSETEGKETLDTSGQKKEEKKPELSELQSQLQSKDTELETLKAENATLKTENITIKKDIEALKNIQAAIDEIQKSPEAFLRKYVPSLLEKNNPYKMIEDRVKNDPKFGADFRFDPSDAYVEGTQSYDFRLRVEEEKDNYRRNELQAEAKRLEAEGLNKVKFEQDKQKIMKDFNLTEDQFKKEIVDWGMKQPNTLYNIAKLRFQDDLIKKAAEKLISENKGRDLSIGDKPKAGVKDIESKGEETPQHLKEWENEFGEKF